MRLFKPHFSQEFTKAEYCLPWEVLTTLPACEAIFLAWFEKSRAPALCGPVSAEQGFSSGQTSFFVQVAGTGKEQVWLLKMCTGMLCFSSTCETVLLRQTKC